VATEGCAAADVAAEVDADVYADADADEAADAEVDADSDVCVDAEYADDVGADATGADAWGAIVEAVDVAEAVGLELLAGALAGVLGSAADAGSSCG